MKKDKIEIRDSDTKKRFCDAVEDEHGDILLFTKICSIRFSDLKEQISTIKDIEK